MEFTKSLILIRDYADGVAHKKIPTENIRACTMHNQEEKVLEEENGSFKRSKSWLSKLRKDDDEKCTWNFNFLLELNDRSMELFAPTRQDREKWMMIFNLIIEMN